MFIRPVGIIESIQDAYVAKFPLHDACLQGDFYLIKSLVNAGNINLKDAEGDTPLNCIMHSSQSLALKISIAEFLLKKGANPNLPNNKGYYPITGLCADYEESTTEMQLPSQDETFCYGLELFIHHESVLDCCCPEGSSLLTFTIAHSYALSTQILLFHHADPNFEDQNGVLPLEAFWKTLHVDYMRVSLKKLLNKGADVEKKSSAGHCFNDFSARAECDEGREQKIIGIVNSYFDSMYHLNILRIAGLPFFYAKSFVQISDPFSDKMFEKVSMACFKYLPSPNVHYGVMINSFSWVSKAIEQGALVNTKEQGHTPLAAITTRIDESCLFEKMKIFKCLLENGGKIEVDKQDELEQIFSTLVALDGRISSNSISRPVLAQKWFVLMCMKYKLMNPLFQKHSLLHYSMLDMCMTSTATTGIAFTLLKNGFDPNHTDRDGITPLRMALFCLRVVSTQNCYEKSMTFASLIQLLLQMGADPHRGGIRSAINIFKSSKSLNQNFPKLMQMFNTPINRKPAVESFDEELARIYTQIEKGPMPFLLNQESSITLNLEHIYRLNKIRESTELSERFFESLSFNVLVNFTYYETLIDNEAQTICHGEFIFLNLNDDMKHLVHSWCMMEGLLDKEFEDEGTGVFLNFDDMEFIQAKLESFKDLHKKHTDQIRSKKQSDEEKEKLKLDPRSSVMMRFSSKRKFELTEYIVKLRGIAAKGLPVSFEADRHTTYLLTFYAMKALEALRLLDNNGIAKNFPIDIRAHFFKLQHTDLLKLVEKLIKIDPSDKYEEARKIFSFEEINIREKELNVKYLKALINNTVADINHLNITDLKSLETHPQVAEILEMCVIKLGVYYKNFGVKDAQGILVTREPGIDRFIIDDNFTFFTVEKIDPSVLLKIAKNIHRV